MVVPPNATREDGRIKENRGRMGVILFRKASRGLSSGSIVKLKGSKLIPNCEKIEYCLMTSDKYVPVRGLGEGDYFIEYWSSDLNTVKKLSLREVAQSDAFYRPTPGMALLPVCHDQSWFSKLCLQLCTDVRQKSSVIDERRAFPTSYHRGGEESENKRCYIVQSCGCSEKESVEQFTLMTKTVDQGQLQYELLHVDDSGNIFRNHDDIIAKWPNLYPHGAVILESDDEPQPTCVGILNFTEEGLISPVFFTPETFTGEVQLYYPSDVQEEASPTAMEPAMPDSAIHSQESPCSTPAPSQAPPPIERGYENQSQVFSSAGGTENPDGASQTNDDLTVRPDDYTLQHWQKLYEEVKDENTKLKQQSELYEEVKDENTKLKQQSENNQKIIFFLKEENAQLRSDIKKTEQENEELRAQNEDLRKRCENLLSRTEEQGTKWKQLLEDRDAENRMLLTENKQWKADFKALHDKYMKLLAENSELRKNWSAEREQLYEVNKELRTQNDKLTTKTKELLTENAELNAMVDQFNNQFKEMLDQPGIKDSNNEKAEEPSGSSANSPQGDSDGSRKEEEPFLDPLSQDVSKLD